MQKLIALVLLVAGSLQAKETLFLRVDKVEKDIVFVQPVIAPSFATKSDRVMPDTGGKLLKCEPFWQAEGKTEKGNNSWQLVFRCEGGYVLRVLGVEFAK